MRSVGALIVVSVLTASLAAQQPGLPPALIAMADTERAFAKRATVVGWKQAFLEYFADDAIGFDGEKTVPAREHLRQVPEPPKDLQLLWEPRFGDVATSGDLGWLTGPSTNINPARNGGAPRHGNYASIWRRQRDRSFKVVLDVGVNLPAPAPFAPGFTRAPAGDRYTGSDSVAAATEALRTADARLTRAALLSQLDAYAGHLADGARLHRTGMLPLSGEASILRWLQPQPDYTAGESRFAEVASSRDMGFTYGTYAIAASGPIPAEKGFYTRVWVRGRDGAWKLALDVLQPQ